MSEITIKRALISVYDKGGLSDIVQLLQQKGIEIVSTGGTYDFIQKMGVPCMAAEDLTDYPSLLGGRVKTLHPAIFGGILTRRGNEADERQCEMYDIKPIDLVIVDLYPFEQTVESGADHADIIEKIDIGGISLIRAAAKNYKDVVVVPSKNQYQDIIRILQEQGGSTTLEERKALAAKAFQVSSSYDTSISHYFARSSGGLHLSYTEERTLRYGENPHQKGYFYGDALTHRFQQQHGKELSYNNLLDIDTAVQLLEEFEAPTATIIKHNTPCGLATRGNIVEAYEVALSCDPVSAFGGIIAVNRLVDTPLAEKLDQLFFEVLIAPEFSLGALEVLKKKKNRILLKDRVGRNKETMVYRSALGGVLAQERDKATESIEHFKVVSGSQPTEQQVRDMQFGMKAVKYCKSNAIVLVKEEQILGAGYGQTSRIDALRHAIEKANAMGFSLHGATLASDAFFPFSDSVKMAHEAGITSIIQPGGSIRDDESTHLAEEYGITMVHTGIRHFRH